MIPDVDYDGGVVVYAGGFRWERAKLASAG